MKVWDNVCKDFNSEMKEYLHQLKYELKTSNKGSKSISEYVLIIQDIANSLLVIDDPIPGRDEIDATLQGLLEEYNQFIMMIYGKGKPTDIYDIEPLLYMQEARLDMYR